MTVGEFKKFLNENNVPDTAELTFWGYGDGPFYQNVGEDVDYNKQKNTRYSHLVSFCLTLTKKLSIILS